MASEGGSAQFFVSAWLVRIWLGLVAGTAIVVGVMIALDCQSSEESMDPMLSAENKAQVVLVKKIKLSYRKLGGGLLCVVVGSALFVTVVFLLPDIRTGHSGIGKMVSHFTGEQSSVHEVSSVEHNVPSGH